MSDSWFVSVVRCGETGELGIGVSATSMKAFPRRQVGVAQEVEGYCDFPDHFGHHGVHNAVVVEVTPNADAQEETVDALKQAGVIFSPNQT